MNGSAIACSQARLAAAANTTPAMKTKIIKVGTSDGLGHFRAGGCSTEEQHSVAHSKGRACSPRLDSWEVATSSDPPHPAIAPLRRAAEYLRQRDVPVAFPTETVYGLGADATRSAAVKGIYAAKGRPSDNPLIVHVCDLEMLRGLLTATATVTATRVGSDKEDAAEINTAAAGGQNATAGAGAPPDAAAAAALYAHDERPGGAMASQDPIPAIYRPLIERFWPGPLTILLPNPAGSRLAPEVTAGLPTFGARMPASALALTLIKLTGSPLAAPSANASTRPSPTTARHVLDDLDGRVELILDGAAADEEETAVPGGGGGDCRVGVESTVVDGLCDPPAVLRPGGVGIEELRACPGWEGVQKAYRDGAEAGRSAPRAPGMKYKHYSPRAKVVLYEGGFPGGGGDDEGVWADLRAGKLLSEKDGVSSVPSTIGIIRTGPRSGSVKRAGDAKAGENGFDSDAYTFKSYELPAATARVGDTAGSTATKTRVLDIHLGDDVRQVAHGLFASLRELDSRGADLICVEGVGDGDDLAAAVMNRLRKAASEIR